LLAYIDEVDLRFAEFLTRVSDERTHSKRTLEWYRRAYDAGLRPYLAEGDASSREAFRARLFDLTGLAGWLRRRVQPITVNNYWRALRPFFNDMEKRDGVPNPYKGAKAPRFNAPPPKGKSVSDCEQILRAARNYPWRTGYEAALAVTLLGVMLFAGLRRSEALDLEYTDVDLGTHTLRIRHGKGMFGGRERIVPLAPQLEHLLRQYMRERDAREIVAPAFFVGVRGRPLGIGSVTHIIKNVRVAAGLHFTAHSLRHSFVTTMIMRGVPLPVVRDVAGHRDFATTLQYTAVQTPDRLAAVSQLDFLSAPSRVRARR
jgi:integrase